MAKRLSLAARAAIIWRTVRYLRLRQAIRYVARRIYRPRVRLGRLLAVRGARGSWVASPAWPREWIDEYSVRIFAQRAAVRAGEDWQRAFPDALRLYHLHYLDQLRATSQPTPNFPTLLLERWVAENPPGKQPAWEPYPISRRIVNVIKAVLGGQPCSERISTSIADQCRYLLPRLETHLLANHLLANAKALIFAGAFLSGPEADEWLSRGTHLLRAEVREQVLGDGGHIERSPMYHAIVLEDLLDLLNLGQRYELDTLKFLRQPCLDMLAWCDVMRHPDGGIPLINDSALGAALPYSELSEYASRLGLETKARRLGEVAELRASGYVRVNMPPWQLFADVGSVGPDYQPGHAHAGTLGCELSFGQERVLVDTGISTYSRDGVRESERGTAAHNTIVVEGADSSEVWDAFRVGARARVSGLSVVRKDSTVVISAEHDGYRRLKCRATHARTWQTGKTGVDIQDEVRGSGTVGLESILHFAPGCVLSKTEAHRISIRTAAGASIAMHLDTAAKWCLEPYMYAPSFGVRIAAMAVHGSLRGRLPQSIRVRLAQEARA